MLHTLALKLPLILIFGLRSFLDKTVDNMESFWQRHGIPDPFKEWVNQSASAPLYTLQHSTLIEQSDGLVMDY
jgi:hypothetical protein